MPAKEGWRARDAKRRLGVMERESRADALTRHKLWGFHGLAKRGGTKAFLESSPSMQSMDWKPLQQKANLLLITYIINIASGIGSTYTHTHKFYIYLQMCVERYHEDICS